MLEKIQSLVADGLGVDADKVVPAASFKDDLGADSLDGYQIVSGVEEELNITITAEDVEQITNVKEAVEVIMKAEKNS